MTLSEFIVEIESGTDTKVLSKMLKDLPAEDRREAGIRFQEAKARIIKEPAIQKRGWTPPGPLLWSLDRGPLGHGLEMYEGTMVLQKGSGKAILITGSNLKFKEIDL